VEYIIDAFKEMVGDLGYRQVQVMEIPFQIDNRLAVVALKVLNPAPPQVIDHRDFEPQPDKAFYKIGADHPSAAGYKNVGLFFHNASLIFRESSRLKSKN
jgi:hypothetical protein